MCVTGAARSSFHAGPAPHTQASEASTWLTGSSCLGTSTLVCKTIDLSPRRPTGSLLVGALCGGAVRTARAVTSSLGKLPFGVATRLVAVPVGSSGCGIAGQEVMPSLAFQTSGLRALDQSCHLQTLTLALIPGSIHLTRPLQSCQDCLPLVNQVWGRGRRGYRENILKRIHYHTGMALNLSKAREIPGRSWGQCLLEL